MLLQRLEILLPMSIFLGCTRYHLSRRERRKLLIGFLVFFFSSRLLRPARHDNKYEEEKKKESAATYADWKEEGGKKKLREKGVLCRCTSVDHITYSLSCRKEKKKKTDLRLARKAAVE